MSLVRPPNLNGMVGQYIEEYSMSMPFKDMLLTNRCLSLDLFCPMYACTEYACPLYDVLVHSKDKLIFTCAGE